MTDVLGHAFIEVKAISKGIDPSVAKAVEANLKAAGTAGGAALEKAISNSAKKAGDALNGALGGDKIKQKMQENAAQIDRVAQRAAAAADAGKRYTAEQVAAQEKLLAAQQKHDQVVQAFGRDSLQARSAQMELAAAGKHVDDTLQKQEAQVNRVSGAFQRGGRVAGTMFGAIASNSQGALGPLGEVYDKVSGIGAVFGTAEGKSSKALLGIGASVTGLGATLSVFASKDQAAEQQLSAAITGTGKSYDDYKARIDAAVKSGEKYGYNATQTMSALNRLTIATHSPDKALQALDLTMNIAAARHLSLDRAATKLGTSINGNTRGLRQFGITVDNSTTSAKAAEAATKAHDKALAQLAKTQQNLTDIEARLAGGRKGAGHASALQIQLDTEKYDMAMVKAKDTLGKYGNSSTQYAAAVMSVQQAQARLQKAEGTGRGITALTISQQITLRKAHDAVAAAQAKVAASTKTMTAAQDAAKKHADTFNQILTQGNKVLGGQAAAASNTFVGHMKAIGASVEDNVAKVGEKVGGALTVAGPALMAFGAIMETGMIQKFASGTKALMLWNEESIIVQGATKAWAGIQWLLNAAMDAMPLIAITVAVAALVAGIIYAYNHFKPFHDLVNAVAFDLKNGFMDAVHWVTNSFQTLWADIQSIWSDITKHFSTWGPIALAVLAPFIGIPLMIYQHWGEIEKWLGGVWDNVQKKFSDSVKWIENLISGWINDEINGWKFLGTKIADAAIWLWDTAKNEFLGGANWVKNLVATFIQDEINGWTNFGTNVWHAATSLWSGAEQRFLTGMSNIRTDVANWGSTALGWLTNAGKDVVNGLVNGVTSMSSHALDAVKGVGSDIVNGVKDFFGIHSPSTVFAELGGHLITGLIHGIIKNGKQVPNLLKGVFGDVAGTASGAMGWLEKQGGGLLDKVMGGAGALGKAFGGLFGGGGGGGGAAQWSNQIAAALEMAGAPLSWMGSVQDIISHESGGNPKAINLTDINAQQGHPSQGLMQTIPSTFAAYAGALVNRGITDPLANIFAGIKYIMARYGSIANVPGIAALANGKAYQGYNSGGSVPGSGDGDTVPALLTPGEFVIPKRIVQSLGVGFFERMRAAKFANGGLVGVNWSNLHQGTSSHTHTHTVSAAAAAKHAAAVAHHAAVAAAAAAHRKAIALAAAAAKRLTISMQNVTYGESLFTASMKAGSAAIAKHPEQYAKIQAGLVKQAAALVATANANERATRGTTKHTAALKAQATALKDLAAAKALVDPNTAAVNSIQASFQSAFKNQDLGTLFNYQAGYGASSVASVIAGLKAKYTEMRAFGDLLNQLARKGLGVDMIQQLIAAGPQAGMGIAREILADPKAIATIQGLETQINSAAFGGGAYIGKATTSVGLAMGGSALTHFASGGLIKAPGSWGDNFPVMTTPGEYVVQKSVVDSVGVPFLDNLNRKNGHRKVGSPYAGPGVAQAHGGQPTTIRADVREGPLMEVHGDLVVRNESDLNKIQADLYRANAAQKRATGMGR